MLTAKNLERLMELEEKLRSEYQVQLDAKSAEIDGFIAEKEDLIADKEAQKAAIATQLEQIKALSSDASANKKVEQRNRELHARCENLQEDITTLKARVKSLQKDISEAREEAKALKQFDPARMKKNLDANKKKLAEKTAAADALQKSLNKSKGENSELQRQVKELESKLAELEGNEEATEESAAA